MSASSTPRRSFGLLIAVAAFTFTLDQLTKWWALERLADGETIDLLFNWRLHLVRNPAAAFSLGEGLGPLVGVLAVGVVGMLLVMSRDYPGRFPTVCVGMVVGGALGNIADRVFRTDAGFLGGEVIDFVDVRRWPVFNLADSAVVVGVALLALYTVFFDRGQRADETDDSAPPDSGPDIDVDDPTGSEGEPSR